jgi:hypothetical protein
MCLIVVFAAKANNHGGGIMNWDVLEAVSAFIASVATLITLIYLAIQIRESNKLARSASLKSILDDFIEYTVVGHLNNPELGDIFDRGQMDYDALTLREKSTFESMLTRDVLQLQNVMQQHEHGLISDTDYQAWLAYISSQLTSPGGMTCWNYMKKVITPTMVSALDDYIEKHPSAPSFIELFSHRFENNSE